MHKKQLHIDQEVLDSLALLKGGLLSPVTKIMNKEEMISVDATKKVNNTSFPFPFLLSPNGKRNEEVIRSSKKGDEIELVCDKKTVGILTYDNHFSIDKDHRVKLIYGTNDSDHLGVKETYTGLGNYSVCGDFTLNSRDIQNHKKAIIEAITNVGAKKISSIMLAARPFHRVHERLIRSSLVKNDMIVLFLLKSNEKEGITYETRYNSIKYFCDNFLPKGKTVIIPLENTNIFGGFNELIFNAIVAKNYGCTEMVVGKTSHLLGAFYEDEKFNSILDTVTGIDISIDIMNDFTYCEKCSTLVSTNACPHGAHHHVNYHSQSLRELLEMGIMPPAIFMRKEISSIILNDLFKDRKEKLAKIHQIIAPSSALVDDFESADFYECLMKLYQTSSLT
jgi:sulfate adenylyltransferase